MTIDFSNKPEGATHEYGDESGLKIYYKIEDGVWMAIYPPYTGKYNQVIPIIEPKPIPQDTPMQTHREILKCLLSFDDAALKKINLYGLVKWRKVAEAFVGGEEIEFINSCVNKWMHCDEPRFEEVGTKYRVIRHKIKIGNVDIVAPEREALKEGENYFLLELGELDGSPIKWENDLHDNEWLKCGLIFLDAEDRNMARKAFTQLLGGE